MAEEHVYQQEFAIRALSTRSVILYPSRAQVIRDINEITLHVRDRTPRANGLDLCLPSPLQPGANEITIYGITPTADESSIKVEGKGSATITDMTVDLIFNKEKYDDFYPKDKEASEDEDEESDSEPENEVIKRYKEESEKLDNLVKDASEEQLSANSRLNILEQYGTTVAKSSPEGLSQGIEQYKVERRKIFEDHMASLAKLKELKYDRAQLDKESRKAREAARREKVKAEKAKSKKTAEKLLAQQEKRQEIQRLKEERVTFWPKKVYRVVLSLETNVDFTPGSSRRGSVSSLVKPTLPPPSAESKTGSDRNKPSSDGGACQIGLAISYVTYSASWSPRYDLNLTTPTRSATITYRAEFLNKTSEYWRDAKIILSTSQTASQGLGELIPKMEPWHISLIKGHGSNSMDDALFSRKEVQNKSKVNTVLISAIDVPVT